MDRVQIIVRDAPVAIVGAVLADAQATNVTYQEAAVRILASRFKVRRVASDRQFVSGTRGGSELHLEVPVELRRKIRQEAARVDGNTMRGVVLATLANHYGLGEVASGRRPRGGKKGGNDHVQSASEARTRADRGARDG